MYWTQFLWKENLIWYVIEFAKSSLRLLRLLCQLHRGAPVTPLSKFWYRGFELCNKEFRLKLCIFLQANNSSGCIRIRIEKQRHHHWRRHRQNPQRPQHLPQRSLQESRRLRTQTRKLTKAMERHDPTRRLPNNLGHRPTSRRPQVRRLQICSSTWRFQSSPSSQENSCWSQAQETGNWG
mgnify:CR=1 FL=1